MKTEVKNAGPVPSTAAKNTATVSSTANRPSLTGREAKQDELAKNSAPAPAAGAPQNVGSETKAGSAVAVDHQAAHPSGGNQGQDIQKAPETETAKAEAGKPEEPEKEIRYIKPAQNLEQTLKTVGSLHRLTVQRLALIARIKTLEDFEVKLVEENDQWESNPYMGCRLTIKDDRGREFTTNTPNLIRMVTQYIFDACHDKLAEIEANIVFPA